MSSHRVPHRYWRELSEKDRTAILLSAVRTLSTTMYKRLKTSTYEVATASSGS